MEFRPTSDEERAWWRIVVRLLAFAGLAERAAYRSMPVRWLVLSILRLAQDIVEELVLDAAGVAPLEPCDVASVGHAPEDALALAARFMALAAMLAGLIRATDWNEIWPAPRGRAGGGVSRAAHLPGGWNRPAHDTS